MNQGPSISNRELLNKFSALSTSEIKKKMKCQRAKSLPPKENEKQNEKEDKDWSDVSPIEEKSNERKSRICKFTGSLIPTRSKSESRRHYIQEIPHMYGSVLIGDDFFLGLASFFIRFQAFYNDDGVFHSGFCASGLTFHAAIELISKIPMDDRNARSGIVYLGSMDIINGRSFKQITEDFNRFVEVCKLRNFHLVICTLAPIPSHQLGFRRSILKQFNVYLRENPFNCPVIDVYKAFLRVTGDFEELYYKSENSEVTGTKEKLALWSKHGLKRAHYVIKKNLGFAIMCKETKVYDFI